MRICFHTKRVNVLPRSHIFAVPCTPPCSRDTATTVDGVGILVRWALGRFPDGADTSDVELLVRPYARCLKDDQGEFYSDADIARLIRDALGVWAAQDEGCGLWALKRPVPVTTEELVFAKTLCRRGACSVCSVC